jgi:acyl-coenzyme A thioesterase PaaI-like protein
MKVSYLGAAKVGAIHAEGRMVKRGRKILFLKGRLTRFVRRRARAPDHARRPRHDIYQGGVVGRECAVGLRIPE